MSSSASSPDERQLGDRCAHPHAADDDGSWRREGDTFVVTMHRRFDTIAMRVHADQSPRLAVEGDLHAVDLAQWGNRSLALSARPGSCAAIPGRGGPVAR